MKSKWLVSTLALGLGLALILALFVISSQANPSRLAAIGTFPEAPRATDS